MRKLYVVMVGLPARGKSTLARRIKECLLEEGIRAAIFNNGDLRRSMLGMESTEAEFYNPENSFGLLARENIARRNMELAKDYLAGAGEVAIMDATNASRARRRQIEEYCAEFPILFIECANEDPLLLDACIRRKTQLPEYAAYSREEALKSFLSRIRYYESIYSPVGEEQHWMRVDAVTNRVIAERPCDHSPYYPAIRDSVVSTWVRCLYLVRHGQTAYNLEGRIGGDPSLTPKGLSQARALATHLQGKALPYIFTSTRVRSHQFAAPLLAERPDATALAMPEFDEIFAGECEGMRYEDIHRDKPEVAKARAADKYAYVYPGGESYADLRERVRRGLARALFLAGDEPLLIVGHQAINRTVLSLFLHQRNEDVPYIYIPQNQYYHLSVTPRKKIFELIKFA
ncbi:MAG: 6-phosphofructo-2-kinase/fructose-2,6-bisphosphatase [Deltaproteobacteria bacterium]|jgi:broad specificity phosphatase PhoE/predicted kinase|nr:6-phosphofructo-2-kinase/fructose-2,6-bisphosphatase [Deltaproteobacteria bacterium]